jgi:hypothetical protein
MKISKKIKEKLVKNTSSFKQVSEADKIIAYLGDKEEGKSLPANLRTKLDRYIVINQLRARYKQHAYIISYLKDAFNIVDEKKARKYIAEAEYIFGKAIYVSRAYELNLLLQFSIKNLELAFATKDVKLITMALDMHHKLLGPEVDESEVPDASKFEQHIYNMILPPNVAELLNQLVSSGAVDLSKVVPQKMIKLKANG